MCVLVRILMVGFGGFAGAVLRYLTGLLPALRASRFPAATFAVNFIGAVLIAFLAGLAPRTLQSDGKAMLFLKVGLCGGFTTFSTFSLETVELLESGHMAAGAGYAALSVAACVGGIYLGRLLARLVAA